MISPARVARSAANSAAGRFTLYPFALVASFVACFAGPACAGEPLRVGFAQQDITPEISTKGPAVWMAGYGMGRRAKGVHDPLFARAVVLEHGGKKWAIAAVDLVGLQWPAVLRIRAELKDFDYVLVASTHNHEGPDVIGIWGGSPFTTGVDPKYIDRVVSGTAAAIRAAAGRLAPMSARYGTVDDESLLNDSRLPKAFDGVLRAIRFSHPSGEGTLGLLVQYSCHPESMGSKNTLITADFPQATVAALEKKYGCPVVYISGAVGGLMSNPGEITHEGRAIHDGTWEYAKVYGERVADAFVKAIDAARPIELTPFRLAHKTVAIPLENRVYQAARIAGLIQRDGFKWTGDEQKLGEPLVRDAVDTAPAVHTEVACLQLGQLRLAAIPGEIYPELLYGKFQEPADPAADFPAAPLEKTIRQIMPDDRWMLVGLANDEIGYIIPKRQWDSAPPFAYGRKEAQYGEINSCGPEVAPIIMRSLERCVKALDP